LQLVQGSVQLVSLQALVLLHPTVGRHDFQRKGRRYQYVGEQRVRVKGDWSEHLVECFRSKCGGSTRFLPQDPGWRCQKANQQRGQSMLESCCFHFLLSLGGSGK
jgi:hypothetical protein